MEEKKLKFEFTVQEVNIILQGLGELQAKISLSLISKINQEAQDQLKEKPDAGNKE